MYNYDFTIDIIIIIHNIHPNNNDTQYLHSITHQMLIRHIPNT